VEALGCGELFETGGLATVACRWSVPTTARRMNVTAPLLRKLFASNHKRVMDEAGEQLARYWEYGSWATTSTRRSQQTSTRSAL
jgi:hypothetical protein